MSIVSFEFIIKCNAHQHCENFLYFVLFFYAGNNLIMLLTVEGKIILLKINSQF